MYAIIETGGKQYQVREDDIVFIERLPQEDGEVVFDKVLAVEVNNEFSFGNPYVARAVVKATLLKNGKSKKITVFTYKPKKGQKRKKGHRQPYSQVKIESIVKQ